MEQIEGLKVQMEEHLSLISREFPILSQQGIFFLKGIKRQAIASFVANPIAIFTHFSRFDT